MRIRRIEESDRARLEAMIATDLDHQARQVTPDFFLSLDHFSMCFEDYLGPVFYVRLDPETLVEQGPVALLGIPSIRVHIQFSNKELIRTARMLFEGFEVVKDRCRVAGARRLVFDSIDATLRTFCMKRFGFMPIPGTADLELYIGAEEVCQK